MPSLGSVHTTSRRPLSTANAWISYAQATLIYLIAVVLTRPIYLSDTMYYLRTADPASLMFWDFGHLLWRPFVWVLLEGTRSAEPSDRLLHVFYLLDSLSTIAGLLTLWFTIGMIRLFTRRIVTSGICAILLSFSQVVLTYSKGGSSYIFGLLPATVALYTLLAATKAQRESWGEAAVAGGFLALSVCLWFPYAFAVPGILSAPLLFSAEPKRQLRLVLEATITCAIIGFTAYVAIAVHLGIRDVQSLVAWIARASHGAVISGGARVVFGFARSFIALGDGILFKRFLLHDPYNPVSIWQILRGTIWKILLFYVFLASVLGTLARSSQGRRALFQLLITSLPVLGFAVAWQGTDVERYLPLFPALVLAVGLGLDSLRLTSPNAYIAGAFALVLIGSNLWALSTARREQRLRESTATVRSLNDMLPAGSLVLFPPMHPLWRIYWDYPEALPLAKHHLELEWLLTLGSTDAPQWRSQVCSRVSHRWDQHAAVVIESSLLQNSPGRESCWVEGDDPRVNWRDIRNFTSQLELGDRIGQTAFFTIPATSRNVQVIDHCR